VLTINARELGDLRRDLTRMRKEGPKQFNIAMRRAVKGVKTDSSRAASKRAFVSAAFAKNAVKLRDRIISRTEASLFFDLRRPNLTFLKGAKFLKNGSLSFPTAAGRKRSRTFFAIPGRGGRPVAYSRVKPGASRDAIEPKYGTSVGSWARGNRGADVIRDSYHTRMIKEINGRIRFLRLKR